MKDKFYTLVTNIGKSKIANAAATQDKLELKTIQVGDSNGNYYEPTEDQTKLKNKVWEGQISSITVDDVNPNWIKIDSLIPSKVGGFTIREVGVFDIEGDLILIAKYPETYKPQLEDGSVKDLTIRLIMEISNVDSVTMKIDPSIILATKKEVDDVEKKLNDKIDNMDLGEIEEKTYNELKKLKTSRKLVVGSYYILTDYRSKYLQPTSKEIKEGDVEKLILFATTEQDFSSQVYSMDHPKDIIYYDFNNNKCEDKSTPRNGFITYRHDTIKNNSAYYDFRALKWIRFCPDKKQYYKDDELVDYEVWKEGEVKLDVLYKADNQLLLAKKAGTPENATDEKYFTPVYSDTEIGCLIEEKTKTFNKSICIKRGELQELLTFANNCHDNTFKKGCWDNVLGVVCYNNMFGHGCSSNTFGVNCIHNTFGNSCINNIFEKGCNSNTFGNSCDGNIFNMNCSYNDFSNYCHNNILGKACINNTFSNSCADNMFYCDCDANTFGNACYKNTFKSGCINNTFENNCYNNTFEKGCYGNNFQNDCSGNTFADDCHSNSFGTYCFNNTFDKVCYYNTFGNGCSRNNFGFNSFYNILGNKCYSNVLEHGCESNTFYNKCHDNTFSANLKHVVVKYLQNKNLKNLSEINNEDFTITITKGKDSNYYYYYYNGSREEYHQIP